MCLGGGGGLVSYKNNLEEDVEMHAYHLCDINRITLEGIVFVINFSQIIYSVILP